MAPRWPPARPPETANAGALQARGRVLANQPRPACAFHEELGWFWPSLFDTDAGQSGKLATRGLPETFFLNAKHEIVGRIAGAGNLDCFEAGLAAINAE